MIEINHDDVIYISAPMTGLPNFGRERMHFAKSLLLDRFPGVEVINPAEVPPEWTWEQAMEQDLRLLRDRATVMVLLSGWEKSRGARMEVGLALGRNLPIITFEELLQNSLPVMHVVRKVEDDA